MSTSTTRILQTLFQFPTKVKAETAKVVLNPKENASMVTFLTVGDQVEVRAERTNGTASLTARKVVSGTSGIAETKVEASGIGRMIARNHMAVETKVEIRIIISIRKTKNGREHVEIITEVVRVVVWALNKILTTTQYFWIASLNVLRATNCV